MEWMHIIWGIGALALAGSAFMGYRLSWKRGLVYALVWASIFTALTLIMNAVGA